MKYGERRNGSLALYQVWTRGHSGWQLKRRLPGTEDTRAGQTPVPNTSEGQS